MGDVGGRGSGGRERILISPDRRSLLKLFEPEGVKGVVVTEDELADGGVEGCGVAGY